MTTMQEVLTPQQIQQYRNAGYSDQDIQNALNEAVIESGSGSALQQSYDQAMQTKDPRSTASQSFFTSQYNENLIQWQLELDSILERIEHMLKGDKISFEDGHMIWKEPKDHKEKRMNDYGVSEIMRILSMYLNRNTILSNYDEDTINDKMLDIGNEIADLIFLKYEAFGLDTLEKRKLYPIFVRELVDTIHSAYLRALHGGERDSLREARTVTQQDNVGQGITINTGIQARERSKLNPMRYLMGKNK